MRRLLPIVLLVLLSSSSIAAKEFRGILPMHSTREDVLTILGPSLSNEQASRAVYYLDEGEVQITFAGEDFQKPNCAVTAGTVLLIVVKPPFGRLPVSSLDLDANKFRKFDPSRPPGAGGYEGFIDDKEGLVIRGFEGKVQEMIYFASATDRARCPGYLANPEELVHTIVCWIGLKFDEYGDISFRDEKARLDNFAIQTLNSENMDAYIIAYAGRKARVAEAQLRANRARDYLINVRKIDPKRIKTIDAGHREVLTVTLYIWPTGYNPPPFEPSIDKSEVELIYEKKKRTPRKRQ